MFTLRLIFYGLIAIVPSAEEDPFKANGFLAMMLDTSRIIDEHGKPMPSHYPIGLVTEGFVDGEDCSKRPCEISIEPYSHFDFDSTDVGMFTKFTGYRLGAGRQPRMLPTSRTDMRDFSWLVSMEALLPGEAANVNPICLYTPEHCPLIATMRVWTGQASTCHLVHYAREGSPNDLIRSFWFRSPHSQARSTQTIQAISDAVVVDIPMREETLTFASVPFSGRASAEPSPFLRADPTTRTLTLLIANVPVRAADYEGSCLFSNKPGCKETLPAGGAEAHHFSSYYSLSAEPVPPEERLAPREFPGETAPELLTSEMSCEEEIIKLTWFIRNRNAVNRKNLAAKPDTPLSELVFTPPHSKEVCIKTQFAPAWFGDLASNSVLMPERHEFQPSGGEETTVISPATRSRESRTRLAPEQETRPLPPTPPPEE